MSFKPHRRNMICIWGQPLHFKILHCIGSMKFYKLRRLTKEQLSWDYGIPWDQCNCAKEIDLKPITLPCIVAAHWMWWSAVLHPHTGQVWRVSREREQLHKGHRELQERNITTGWGTGFIFSFFLNKKNTEFFFFHLGHLQGLIFNFPSF